MISSLGKIMLYVNDLDACASFWHEKVGFERIKKIDTPDGEYIYELSPKQNSNVHLVLQDKVKIAKMSPELNLGTPSILMQTENIVQFHHTLRDNGVQANDIITMPGMTVFNFCDNEGNYFAVEEVKA